VESGAPLPGRWTTIANGDDIRRLTWVGDVLWASTFNGGAVRWDPATGAYAQFLYPQDGLPGNDVRDVALAPDGSLWFATGRGLGHRLADGQWTVYTWLNTSRRANRVSQVTADAALDATQLQADFTSSGYADAAFPDGLLMIGDDPTVYFYDGAFRQADGPTYIRVRPGLTQVAAASTSIYAVSLGLPSDDVTTVAVGADGVVWAGTRQAVRRSVRYQGSNRAYFGGGLARFDGTTWTRYTYATNNLAADAVTGLSIDPATGHIWVTAESHWIWLPPTDPTNPNDSGSWASQGGGVSVYDGATWTTYRRDPTNPNSFPSHSTVRGLAVDSQGRKWFATQGGLNVLDGRNWSKFTTANSGLPYDDVWAVAVDPANRVWVSMRTALGDPAGVAVLDHNGTIPDTADDTWMTYTAASGLPADGVRAIAVGPDGRVWFGASDRKGHGAGLRGLAVGASLTDPADDTWTDLLTTAANGLRNNRVSTFAFGPDGSTWFGTGDLAVLGYGQGVSVRRPDGAWIRFDNTQRQFRGDPVTTVLDAAAVGSQRVKVNFTSLNQARAALPSGYVMFGSDPSVYKFVNFYSSSQSMTISPALRQPVARGDPVYAVIVDTGTASNRIGGIAFDDSGKAWVAARQNTYDSSQGAWIDGGLSVYDGRVWSTYTQSSGGLVHNSLSDVAVEPAACGGRVWAGTGSLRDYSGFGLSRFNPATAQWTTYTTANRLTSNDITDIAIDPTSCKVWVATAPYNASGYRTGGGVSVYDPATDQWSRFCNATGSTSCRSSLVAFDNDVRAVAVDAAGRAWIGAISYSGSCFSCAGPYWDAVVNWFDGTTWNRQTFPGDGIVSAIAIDRDGQVWAGTSRNRGDYPDLADGGIHVFDGQVWRAVRPDNSGLADKDVQAIAVDPAGRVWIALLDGGVSVYDPIPPTPTPTATSTPTDTPTVTPTPTATTTPSLTPTPTPTATPTDTPTATQTPTVTPSATLRASLTPTATATGVPTATPTDTPSPTPTATHTPSVTPTDTATATPTASATATATPTATASATPSPTPTSTVTRPWAFTATPTPDRHPVRLFLPVLVYFRESGSSHQTATPAVTRPATPTGTVPPTLTHILTPSPSPTERGETDTPTPTHTLTPSPSPTGREETDTPTVTATATCTASPSLTPTATATPRPPTPITSPSATLRASPTPTVTQSATASPTLTDTPTASPTLTATDTPTVTTSPTATATPSATLRASPTGTPTATATPTDTATPTGTPTPVTTPTVTGSPTPTRTPVWQRYGTVGTDLYDVDFVDSQHGWAVGAGGLILRYDGRTWQPESSGVSQDLHAVDMFMTPRGVEGWASGDGLALVHYANGVWQPYPTDTFPLDDYWGLAVADTGEGWAIGRNSKFLHLADGEWTPDGGQPGNFYLVNDVYLSRDGSRGWAVGDAGNLAWLHDAGRSWQTLGKIVISQGHYAVSLVPDPSNVFEPWYGWVVGEYWTGGANGDARWPGNTQAVCGARIPPCWLTIADPPPASLYGVQILSKTDGWAVGQAGAIFHWDGQAWTAVPSPGTRTLRAVVMVTPDEGWAVGDGGDILKMTR
jgi:ligand-binding sensor domain-containing protein